MAISVEEYLAGLSNKTAGDLNFLDYDTVQQGDVAMRILGLDAPEVQNFTDKGVKPQDPQGHLLGDMAADLAKSMGATRVQESGKKDVHGRPLINLTNNEGQDFTDRSYYEGILRPDDFTSERHYKLYRDGKSQRAFEENSGIESKDIWAEARRKLQLQRINNIDELERTGQSPMKELAFNEEEWAKYNNFLGDEYNPFFKGEVKYHTPGAKFDNTAYSPIRTSFNKSIISMKSGWQGINAAWADMLGNEDNWLLNTSEANELERQMNEMPTYISSVSDVEGWKDAGEYIAGLGGMMTPYLLGIAGSAAAASIVIPTAAVTAAVGATAAGVVTLAAGALPMALIYGGQTYNDMEGTMSEKNAGYALTAGIVMATLDRLGLRGIIKAADVIKNNSDKEIVKAFMKEQNKIRKEKNIKSGNTSVFHSGYLKPMTLKEAELKVQKAFVTDASLASLGLTGLVDLPLARNLIMKQAGGDLLQGATREGITELGQEMAQYGAAVLGSNKEWENSEAGDRALNAIIGGMTMGGILSPAISTPIAINQRRKLRTKFQTSESEINSDNEIDSEDWYRSVINNARSGAELGSQNNSEFDVGPQPEGTPYTIRVPVTVDERETVQGEADQHKDIDNKLKNKGLMQWVQDIPKNFISRPLEWFWKSDMYLKAQNSTSAQAIMSLFSATNKDVLAGRAIQDIENQAYSKFSNLVMDLSTSTRALLGISKGKKGRQKMQKFLAQLYFAADVRSKKLVGLTKEQQANLKNLNDNLTVLQQQELMFDIDTVATELNRDIHAITGKNIGMSGRQLLGNLRPDKTLVKKNKAKVRQLLKNAGWGKDKDIDNLLKVIEDAPEGSSYAQAVESSKRKGIKDVVPAALLPKRLAANPFNIPGMEEFANQDMIMGLESTSRELIHNALVDHFIGRKGRHLLDALALAKRDAGESWDPKFASDIISAAEIWMGVYNPIQNQMLKEIQANITSFNLITLLGTSGPAQLPELWAATLGRIQEDDGGRPLIADLKKISGVVAKHYYVSGKDIVGNYSKFGKNYSDSWTPNRLRFGAAGWGGVKYGAIGQQGLNAEEIESNRLRSAISSIFITVSLIKPLTDLSRIGADFIANDALFHHMDVLDGYLDYNIDENGVLTGNSEKPMSVYVKSSYDLMAETRMPPLHTLKLWKKMKDDVNKKFRNVDFSDPEQYAFLEQEIAENHKELKDIMDMGRKQWVDNSLANPGAATKSRISNDPHYALLFQFRGYILTFAASIVPRLVKRAISKNPNVDLNAITTMAGLVAMGFLGQALKDEWKTEGRPYWLDDAEMVQRGVQASGMLGPFDFLFDAINPIYGESSVWNSMEGLMGPTWGNVKQFSKIGKNTIAGQSDAAINAALKMVPIFGAKQSFREDPIGTITNPILGDR